MSSGAYSLEPIKAIRASIISGVDKARRSGDVCTYPASFSIETTTDGETARKSFLIASSINSLHLNDSY